MAQLSSRLPAPSGVASSRSSSVANFDIENVDALLHVGLIAALGVREAVHARAGVRRRRVDLEGREPGIDRVVVAGAEAVGEDARLVAGEREHEQLGLRGGERLPLDLLGVDGGVRAGRPRRRGAPRGHRRGMPAELLLEIDDALQVLIEPRLVVRAEPRCERLRVGRHEIEHALARGERDRRDVGRRARSRSRRRRRGRRARSGSYSGRLGLFGPLCEIDFATAPKSASLVSVDATPRCSDLKRVVVPILSAIA